MDDAEFAAQKARIEALIARWVEPLGLGWWDLKFGYVREDFDVDGKPAPETAGKTTANWRYAHAYIGFNMPRVRDLSDEDLERCFVHELTHVFLNEARENGDDWLDHEERVASTLTKAFLWLRQQLAGNFFTNELKASPEVQAELKRVAFAEVRARAESANGAASTRKRGGA